MSDNDPAAAILRELAELRRGADTNRLMLLAIVAIAAVSLALLIVLVAR